MLKSSFIWVLSGLGVLAALTFLAGFLFRQEAATIQVRQGTAVNAVPATVSVRAEYSLEVRTDFGGRIAETFLEEGRRVKAGEVLAQMDTADLLLEMERLKIKLKTAEQKQALGSPKRYEVADAEEALANAKRLFEQGQLSEFNFNRQSRNLQRLKDSLALEELAEHERSELLRNNLQGLERKLDKMTVRAPLDGVITRVWAFPGDLIDSHNSIATVVSEGRIVEAEISEERLAEVRSGQEAFVRFLAYRTHKFDARVDKVLPAADPETQRNVILLIVDIETEWLAPGLSGEASIIVETREDALLIPARALMGDHVFAVNRGKLELRRVEVGFRSLTQAEILSGLSVGEEVVVEELVRFRDGDRVKIKK